MNILFCGDKNMEDGLYLSVLSLLKNTTEPLDIFIFTMKLPGLDSEPISRKFISGIEKELKQKNPKNRIRLFDLSDLVQKESARKNMKTIFTPYCMLRLYADLVEEIPDKLLYLDMDVLAYRNIDDFYATDVSNYELAGVLDNYGSHFFHQRSILKKDYLNSGVLLLNMKKIRETGLFKRARELCRTKKMFMPDQSALNRLVEARLILPRKFNEQKEMRPDTVLRHFTTTVHFFPYFRVQKIKPWQVEALHKTLRTFEFDDIIEYYRKHIQEVKAGGRRG